MPFGASLPDGGGVTSATVAPGGAHANSSDEGAPSPPWWKPMLPTPKAGGTCQVPEAAAGQRYHWRIDDEPAERARPGLALQPGRRARPSEVVDPQQFAWDDRLDRPALARGVLYELHVGTFTPEGTFAAAQQRLQELADLGITPSS
jgi:maltooligosyltrehalose trehalohydrolase